MIELIKYISIVWYFIVIAVLPQQIWADEDKRLSDTAELSFVRTGGNTDVATFAGKNALRYDFTDRLFGVWKLEGLYGETDSVKSAERYDTRLRGDYKISDSLYWYGFGGWRQDRFADLENRYDVGTGAGLPVLKGERNSLSFEFGLNYNEEEYTNGTRDDFFEGRAFGLYEFIYDNDARTKFTQEIEYLYNFKDDQRYKVNATTAFTTAINKMLSIKISYEIRYDNIPVSKDLERTDTLFSTALVLNY